MTLHTQQVRGRCKCSAAHVIRTRDSTSHLMSSARCYVEHMSNPSPLRFITFLYDEPLLGKLCSWSIITNIQLTIKLIACTLNDILIWSQLCSFENKTRRQTDRHDVYNVFTSYKLRTEVPLRPRSHFLVECFVVENMPPRCDKVVKFKTLIISVYKLGLFPCTC
jgi:hypothetical protein